MAVNNFKPFGIGASANVTTQAAYEALAALSTGFQAGTASSAQVNKALRQGSVMASVLAQFIANSSGADVLDNGDMATPLANLLLGLKANTAGSFLQTANNFVEIKNAGATAVSAALANLGLGDSNGYVGRMLGAPKIITSSGSYTPTVGTKYILVEVQGAGGGGGGSAATDSASRSVGGGGASGCFVSSFIAISTLTLPVAMIIGAGGAAGAAGGSSGGSGGTGGTTSFGSIITALGGFGGGGGALQTATSFTLNGGGQYNASAGGNLINGHGASGTQGFVANIMVSGGGGSSYFSGGGTPVSQITSKAGDPGQYGSGGSGGISAISSSTGSAGGVGGTGIIRISEFA
jgi:hypothetical protein